MGRTTAVVAMVVVLAACGTTEAGQSSTTTVTSISATTTTVSSSTTVDTVETDPCAGEPDTIDERGLRLVPGCVYRTEQFAFPIAWEAPSADWLTLAEPNLRAVYLGIDEDGNGSADASLAFLAFEAGTQDNPFEAILSLQGVALLLPSAPAQVGGIDAVAIDVFGDEEPTIEGFSGCTTTGVRFLGGYGLVLSSSNEGKDYGIPACLPTRVWQLEVEGQPIAIVAAPHDGDRFDEFMPIFEDFLQNNVAFGDAGE